MLFAVFNVYAQDISSNNATGAGQADRRFKIRQPDSVLRIYVGRAGVLSRMGHNHVISSHAISGEIFLAADPMASHAFLDIPVNLLVVDDDLERERGGDRFSSTPSTGDKSATRENMLGPRVLDSQAYPAIHVTVDTLSAGIPEWRFSLTLAIRGNTFSLELPASISADSDRIIIDSTFRLEHQDIGLRPYSVMGGMLKVANTIEFDLHIEGESY